MSNLFSQVMNMSMTGSVVILLVMLSRLILKRAPKIFSYALWSVVLFRLLCPVAFTAPVSVLNALEPEVQEASESTSVVYFIPAEFYQAPDFTTAKYFIFLALKKLQLNPEVSTICFRTPLDEDQEMSLYRYFKSVEQL